MQSSAQEEDNNVDTESEMDWPFWLDPADDGDRGSEDEESEDDEEIEDTEEIEASEASEASEAHEDYKTNADPYGFAQWDEIGPLDDKN